MAVVAIIRVRAKKTRRPRTKSLFPLDFREALAALRKVKPKPKAETDKAIRQKEKRKKKPGD